MARHHLAKTLSFLVLSLCIAVGSMLLVGRARAATPTPAPPSGLATSVVTQKDNGAWKYATTVSDRGQVRVSIGYDRDSVQGLKGFVQANANLAKTLNTPGTKVDALITFNRPFTIDEFKKFVADNGLNVASYTIRATAPNGHRWTIGGSPKGTDLVPQDLLDKQFGYTQTYSPNAVLNGVVDVTTTFDAAQYAKLQATPGVFLVDITRSVAVAESRKAAPQAAGAAKLSVDESHPYWTMEDLGLQNFR